MHVVAKSYYRECLKRELARRCEKNPRYSLRAFSKALSIDATTVSRLLAGKQVPSHRLSQRIFSALELSPVEQERFLSSVAETHRSRGLKRLAPIFKRYQPVAVPVDLSVDVFRIIADWYHFAILELVAVRGFKPDPKWIAAELGITPTEAALACDRLIGAGLLERSGQGLARTNEQLSTADKHLTTPALRRHQRQALEKAIQSLENDPIETRHHSTLTMAIDESKVAEANLLIREFKLAMSKLLESGKKTRVYNLGICLYPLQKRNDQIPSVKNGESK